MLSRTRRPAGPAAAARRPDGPPPRTTHLEFAEHLVLARRLVDQFRHFPILRSIGIAGNLVAPVQRKKTLVDGSVFVNREEWTLSPPCAPSFPSRRRGASVQLRRSSISCPRSSPSASRSSSGSCARTCFTARPAR